LTERRILVIENEKILAEMIEDYFARTESGFVILYAKSVPEAVDLIRRAPIDLIICDHKGPGDLNGLELLRNIHKLDVIVQVILHTDKRFECDRTTALSLGCANFLLKPFPYDQLCELVRNMLQSSQGFTGRVVKIRLEDVIQMFCYRKESTLVSVFNGAIWGSIYVHNGGIIHAECDDITGIEAFYEILGWDKGEFLSQIVLSVPPQTVFMDWQSLLMEGVRQKDEIRHALEPIADTAVGTPPAEAPADKVLDDDATVRRIMVVDDSRFIRKIVFEILQSDPFISVAGYATNGQEALAKIDELKPDLILLDWDMPVMKGSTTLMHIMIRSPCPVVILSGFVGGVGANPFDLLCLGGVDFLRKPQNNWRMDGRADDLVFRVKEASRIKHDRIRRVKIPQPVKKNGAGAEASRSAERLVVLGAATGGSIDLIRIIPGLPEDYPVAVLVLHDMQQEAIGAFIDYLDRRSRIRVQPLKHDVPLLNGIVYVHPASAPIELSCRDDNLTTQSAPFIQGSKGLDHFLISASHVLGANLITVLLSGRADRGVTGMKFVKDLGGTTIVQDPEASVDPRLSEAALKEGIVDLTCLPDNVLEKLHALFEQKIS
jgi:two-component system, chemotaxis family, protein-glutamate methylesterase/glutaminase